MPFTQPPSRADLFAWLGMADPGGSPDEYDLCLAAAIEAQAARCDVTVYGPDLHEAALRRTTKDLAAKGMALGVYDSPDFGQSYLPRWDAVTQTLEAAHLLGGFA